MCLCKKPHDPINHLDPFNKYTTLSFTCCCKYTIQPAETIICDIIKRNKSGVAKYWFWVIGLKRWQILTLSSRNCTLNQKVTSQNYQQLFWAKLSEIFKKKYLEPGGYSNYFLTECVAWGLKPLPISKDFSHSKKWLNIQFFRNFHKSRPISKAFLLQKWLILPFFLQILWNGTLL